MTKNLHNPLELSVVIQYDGTDVTTDLSAHYGRESDGVSDRKGIPVTLTPAQETTIKQFVVNVVIPQIKAAEGI